MIKGVLLTAGILLVVGAGAAFMLAAISDSMADAPSGDEMTGVVGPCLLVAFVGITMVVGAFFVP